MNKMFLFILLTLLFSAAHAAQIRYSITTDHQTYVYGQNIYVTIKAVNPGPLDDTLVFGSCLQADFFFDSLDWASGFAWCQIVTSRIIPAGDSTEWALSDFLGMPVLDSGVITVKPGRHSIVGTVGRYWTSDTVWVEVSPVSTVAGPGDLPRAYALDDNFPNPFNPSTTIRFSIPEASPVVLKVYNLLGEEIATLVQSRLAPGTYNRVLNANGLASGVYLYRLRAGSFTSTKKMLLMK